MGNTRRKQVFPPSRSITKPFEMNNSYPKRQRDSLRLSSSEPTSQRPSRSFSDGSRVSRGAIQVQTSQPPQAPLESGESRDKRPKATPKAKPDEERSLLELPLDFRKKSVRLKPHAFSPKGESCGWKVVVALVAAPTLFMFLLGVLLPRKQPNSVWLCAGPRHSVPSIQALKGSEKCMPKVPTKEADHEHSWGIKTSAAQLRLGLTDLITEEPSEQPTQHPTEQPAEQPTEQPTEQP